MLEPHRESNDKSSAPRNTQMARAPMSISPASTHVRRQSLVACPCASVRPALANPHDLAPRKGRASR